jgi:phosphatidate cytidylyltransferase
MLRLVSGVVLAVAALAAILFLPVVALRVLACVVAALAAREYLRITHSSFVAIVAVVLSCWIASAGSAAYLSVLVWVVLALVVVQVLALGEPLPQAAAGAFAVFYIGVPLGLLVAVHAHLGWPGPVLLMGTVILSDTAQYYTGRLLGRRLLAPAISPKKTIEGALGGVAFGSLFVALAGQWVFPGAPRASMVALGVSMVLVGICGDLFESRLKRTAHVKDSSALIPGHGGVLDRIDALLFATPVFFLYAAA